MSHSSSDSDEEVHECTVVKGHGSAWDTTCGLEVSDATENAMIAWVATNRVTLTVVRLRLGPNSHGAINTAKAFALKYDAKKEKLQGR